MLEQLMIEAIMVHKPVKLDKRKSRIVARLAAESRHFVRGRLSLKGRFLAANGWEYPFDVQDISPGGMNINSDFVPPVGQDIVLMVEDIGRLQAKVVRITEGGFAVALQATARKRDQLGDQLTWLINARRLGLNDDRSGDRGQRQGDVHILLEDGTRFVASAIDVSLSGMAIETNESVKIGEQVQIGKLSGRITRKMQTGFAIRFDPPEEAE
jgi:hypothetical protein